MMAVVLKKVMETGIEVTQTTLSIWDLTGR